MLANATCVCGLLYGLVYHCVPVGIQATAADLTMATQELFSHTAVPDIFWSDGGPQFISKQFYNFSTQWGLSIRFPLLAILSAMERPKLAT